MRNNSQKRLQSETKGQVVRPSSEQDRIDSALDLMCRRLNKVLTAERINLWHADLASYPVEAIEYVLDAWGRNARALPVLSDLVGMLRTWMIPTRRRRDEPGCPDCVQGWQVTNPTAKKSDWKMVPCPCLTDESLRVRRDPNPLSKGEIMALDSQIKAFCGSDPKKFSNGNPRLNVQLMQGRALASI